MWWRDAVVYQIYPRSFQDSDGDGVGDLAGIMQRLDHLADLGVDALWLSPIYPSPLADFGYDVSDYEAIDPRYGTFDEFDELVSAAHAKELRVLLDLVPSHTSIEHRWFREHPDWYIWAEGGPPNNWVAAFGGSAWSLDERRGGWYLHSFYPEQPDLDWRNLDVVAAMQQVVRFWLDRGVDGFRLDAIDVLIKDAALRDNPPAKTPFALPLHEEAGRFDRVYTSNRPEVGSALAAIREAAGGAFLVGEVYRPTADLPRYFEQVDAAFAFEFLHAPWDGERLRQAIGPAAALPGIAWVLSNHDFPRVVTRFGAENARAAALLLLTLPGLAFVYQGDEIGLSDGDGADPPFDRAGRDGARHPMQWEPEPVGGFSTGEPWLPPVDPEFRNVADQRADPGSLLALYRAAIALRRRLGAGFRLVDGAAGVVEYVRGDYLVAVNTTAESRPTVATGPVVLATHPDAGESPGTLPAHAGVVAMRE